MFAVHEPGYMTLAESAATCRNRNCGGRYNKEVPKLQKII